MKNKLRHKIFSSLIRRTYSCRTVENNESANITTGVFEFMLITPNRILNPVWGRFVSYEIVQKVAEIPIGWIGFSGRKSISQ